MNNAKYLRYALFATMLLGMVNQILPMERQERPEIIAEIQEILAEIRQDELQEAVLNR